MKDDIYFMTIAIEEAKKALQEDEVPVGCIIVKDGIIIGRGHNTRQKENNIFGHAEINAIREACNNLNNYRLDNCVAYITLEPCTMCASALQQVHIKRICYGASDIKMGACGGLFDFFQTPRLNHYPYIFNNILEEECSQLLKDYFYNKRLKNNK